MHAELSGSGGTVGLNPDTWVWAGEKRGPGWAQPLGRAPTSDGECSPNPTELRSGVFQGFPQRHLAGNFLFWRLENKTKPNHTLRMGRGFR